MGKTSLPQLFESADLAVFNTLEDPKMAKKWLAEFHAASRLAMQETPQLLEAYGLVVPSQK